jgi:hypothetical protein
MRMSLVCLRARQCEREEVGWNGEWIRGLEVVGKIKVVADKVWDGKGKFDGSESNQSWLVGKAVNQEYRFPEMVKDIEVFSEMVKDTEVFLPVSLECP